MRRISTKELEDRIKVINDYTNNKYDLRLYTTTGCGVDIKINGKFQTEELKMNRNFTNKEAMKLLDDRFSKEIRSIVIAQNN